MGGEDVFGPFLGHTVFGHLAGVGLPGWSGLGMLRMLEMLGMLGPGLVIGEALFGPCFGHAKGISRVQFHHFLGRGCQECRPLK